MSCHSKSNQQYLDLWFENCYHCFCCLDFDSDCCCLTWNQPKWQRQEYSPKQQQELSQRKNQQQQEQQHQQQQQQIYYQKHQLALQYLSQLDQLSYRWAKQKQLNQLVGSQLLGWLSFYLFGYLLAKSHLQSCFESYLRYWQSYYCYWHQHRYQCWHQRCWRQSQRQQHWLCPYCCQCCFQRYQLNLCQNRYYQYYSYLGLSLLKIQKRCRGLHFVRVNLRMEYHLCQVTRFVALSYLVEGWFEVAWELAQGSRGMAERAVESWWVLEWIAWGQGWYQMDLRQYYQWQLRFWKWNWWQNQY